MLPESTQVCAYSFQNQCYICDIIEHPVNNMKFRIIACIAMSMALFQPLLADTVEKVYDNGLKLIVLHDDRAPVVVSQLWYHVGASYEHEGITGISHALEHLMFKSTDNADAGEFSRVVAERGGSDNAFTGKHYTTY